MGRWALLLAAGLAAGLQAHVSPHVVFAGGAVRLTCTVPKSESNRYVEMAIEGYTSHMESLDGERAAVTHSVLFLHVPCDIGNAVCIVNGDQTVSDKLAVAGCE